MKRNTFLTVIALSAAWGAVSAPPSAAVESVADSVTKYRFLGKTARDKDDHEGVVRYYAQLLKYEPSYRPALYHMGHSLLEMGRADEAKAALLQSARLDSTHANTALCLYQIYTTQAKPDSAWVFLSRLIRAEPGELRYCGYRRAIADLYRRDGNALRAIEHYTALANAEVVPKADRDQIYEILALLHADRGDFAQALSWRQHLAGSAGVNHVEALANMVDLQVETKDYTGAYATLRELARIDSAGRYGHFHRMSVLADQLGDRPVRLEALEGMARVEPRDIETVATIAEIHLQREDLESAARWILRGLGNDPTDAHLRVLNGDLLAHRGTEDGAIAEYERALKDPNWASVAQQRIWQIRPPETEEEKLKKAFFGGGQRDSEDGAN